MRFYSCRTNDNINTAVINPIGVIAWNFDFFFFYSFSLHIRGHAVWGCSGARGRGESRGSDSQEPGGWRSTITTTRPVHIFLLLINSTLLFSFFFYIVARRQVQRQQEREGPRVRLFRISTRL